MTLFIIKEVTENAVTRYRLIIIIIFGSRFIIIIIIFLLASKSCMYLFPVSDNSYTSLGHCYKSKTCASY